MENVPGLAGHKVFQQFVETLQAEGYNVSYRLIDCSEYGLPQKRRRLVLLASKMGDICLTAPAQFGRPPKTVWDAIKRFPALENGSTDPRDPLHRCARLSPLNQKRIKASVPGGTWKDWPSDLVADCHRKETGQSYSSVYSRMEWDRPSPTITTQFYGFGTGRFGHPEQDRALSLREGAALQSFPQDYQFVPPGEAINQRVVGRMIGNAVPVLLGELIGHSILTHISAIDNRFGIVA